MPLKSLVQLKIVPKDTSNYAKWLIKSLTGNHRRFPLIDFKINIICTVFAGIVYNVYACDCYV